jgi:hypothetical protein
LCEICCSRGLFKFDENLLRVCPKSSLHFEQQFQCCLLGFISKAAYRLRGIATGRVMFFLLRMAFWLCVICVLLPSTKSTSPDAQIQASEAVTFATAAVSDVRSFCERQPDACVTGGKVAVALGHKAEAGARTLYEFITRLREKSAAPEKADNKADAGQGTLTPSDMAPAWRGPVPLPPRREARTNGPAA